MATRIQLDFAAAWLAGKPYDYLSKCHKTRVHYLGLAREGAEQIGRYSPTPAGEDVLATVRALGIDPATALADDEEPPKVEEPCRECGGSREIAVIGDFKNPCPTCARQAPPVVDVTNTQVSPTGGWTFGVSAIYKLLAQARRDQVRVDIRCADGSTCVNMEVRLSVPENCVLHGAHPDFPQRCRAAGIYSFTAVDGDDPRFVVTAARLSQPSPKSTREQFEAEVNMSEAEIEAWKAHVNEDVQANPRDDWSTPAPLVDAVAKQFDTIVEGGDHRDVAEAIYAKAREGWVTDEHDVRALLRRARDEGRKVDVRCGSGPERLGMRVVDGEERWALRGMHVPLSSSCTRLYGCDNRSVGYLIATLEKRANTPERRPESVNFVDFVDRPPKPDALVVEASTRVHDLDPPGLGED